MQYIQQKPFAISQVNTLIIYQTVHQFNHFLKLFSDPWAPVNQPLFFFISTRFELVSFTVSFIFERGKKDWL